MQQTIFHVRKKDTVQVMSGKEKGKTGKVLRVNHKHGKVFVEKINMVKRHTKATQSGPGGITEKEGGLFASVLLVYCDKCARGVRSKTKLLDGGKKARVCVKCNGELDK